MTGEAVSRRVPPDAGPACCAAPNCCGPGSYCCAHAGTHDHDDDHDVLHVYWHEGCHGCQDRANRLEDLHRDAQAEARLVHVEGSSTAAGGDEGA